MPRTRKTDEQLRADLQSARTMLSRERKEHGITLETLQSIIEIARRNGHAKHAEIVKALTEGARKLTKLDAGGSAAAGSTGAATPAAGADAGSARAPDIIIEAGEAAPPKEGEAGAGSAQA